MGPRPPCPGHTVVARNVLPKQLCRRCASLHVWDTERLHNNGVLQLLGRGRCGPRAEAS